MNLTDMQARCSFRYRDTGNNLVTNTEWTNYLNDTYMDVAAADPNWPFLEGQTTSLALATGTGTISLPTNVWRVTSVYNATDKWPLAPLHGRSEYRHWFPDPTAHLGSPTYYRLRGNTLEVFPYPDRATTLHADTLGPPALLAAGSDVPVFPEPYHRVLVLGALSKAYEDDLQERWAVHYQTRYERLLQEMRAGLLSPRTEAYARINDTF